MEIYKRFEPFKKQSQITVAKYLQHLDVTSFQIRSYRKIKYDHESLIRLILYKKIKGFKFDTKLTKHLRRNPKERYHLGFTKTPDRRQISYFTNQILTDETKQKLNLTADKIIEISEKLGILLDVKIL